MTISKQRYYLHGDQKEGEPELWFCSSCDLFVPEVHFLENHHPNRRESDYERYQRGKKSLPIYMKNTQGKFYRPDNPTNCLD